jgi:hypothetical protein
MDSVVASEAIDVGSIPAARTNIKQAVEKLWQFSLCLLCSNSGHPSTDDGFLLMAVVTVLRSRAA